MLPSFKPQLIAFIIFAALNGLDCESMAKLTKIYNSLVYINIYKCVSIHDWPVKDIIKSINLNENKWIKRIKIFLFYY